MTMEETQRIDFMLQMRYSVSEDTNSYYLRNCTVASRDTKGKIRAPSTASGGAQETDVLIGKTYDMRLVRDDYHS